MEPFDFDNNYSDADFEFTLEDILNEFNHSETISVDAEDLDMSSFSQSASIDVVQNASTSTNATYDKGDSIIDYSNSNDQLIVNSEDKDLSEVVIESNDEYQNFDSYFTKPDPDVDNIINEILGEDSATQTSVDYLESTDIDNSEDVAESTANDVQEEVTYETQPSDQRQFASFQEDWDILKQSFSNSANGIIRRISSLFKRNRSTEVELNTDSFIPKEEADNSTDDYVPDSIMNEADIIDGEEYEENDSVIESHTEGSPVEYDNEESYENEVIDDPAVFSPEISTEEEAMNSFASNVTPEDDFGNEDPDEPESSFVSYYLGRLKSFWSNFVAAILSIFHGKNVEHNEDSSNGNKPSRIVQYLAALSLKIQQSRNSADSAPARDAEELGPELSSEKASRYYGSHIKFMKHRLKIAAVLCVVLAYIAFGLPVPGRLNNTVVVSSACLALELSVIVCCLDIFTAGILDLIRKRPNANTLVSISCLLSIIDAIIISMGGQVGVGLPYCAISAITITCTLWASILYCRGNRITLRTLALSKNPYAITAEPDIGGYSDLTLLKTKSSTESFVRRTEEKALDDELYTIIAPWLIGLSILLSLIAALVGKTWSSFFHIWSAIFMPAAPFCILLSFPLPFLYTARSLFHNGTAIAGWSGLCDIGESKHIIVKDDDVFPKNTISIDSIRILEGVDPQKIITYTGSIIIASGSALSPAFSELMNKNSCVIEQVSDFKCHEGGGLTAMINGDEVLCGNSGFMHLMGIHIPQKLASKSSVFVAVNGVISAIYAIKYTPVVSVQKALITLLRSRRTSIFAVKDFNITPEMIRHKFKMPSDRFDFPSFADRYAIAGAKRGTESKIAAVVARDGISSMVQLQDEGHRLYSVVRLSVLLSVLCTVIGMILVFLLSLSTALDSISVGNLLLYMLIWLIIQIVVVVLQNR